MILNGVDAPAKVDSTVTTWINEIDAARKREKDWRKEGDEILDIYAGKKKDIIPFNILFSNTETLFPALYSTVPRPVVGRRFKGEDPVGKAAATAGERVLSYLIDTNIEGYETYDDAMKAATLDALLPGRGATSVKYDAKIGQVPVESQDKTELEPKEGTAADAAEDATETTPYKTGELVCCQARSWNKVYFGYATKWSKVPWLAYDEDIDKAEAVELFGEDVANELVYTTAAEDADKEDAREKSDAEAKGEVKTTKIYQIWDRDGGRKVRFISPQIKDRYLKVLEDPLGLTGFFNIPKPLALIEKSNDLAPTAPYKLYENQAEELNRLTVRIQRLISAIKARGVYDSELGEDLKKILSQDENDLVPATNSSSIASEKGIQNAIWMWPVDKLIQVLRELYVARESCKQVIFEIMGIADIMRGTSHASETLGAQEIKQAWGGLRLKRSQKEVQRYARDLLRMMLEIAATKFSQDTWARMTGLPYLTDEQFAKAQAMAQAIQQQMAMVQQQAQMTGQQVQPPPELQQQMQQVQQQLQQPRWADILATLKDDLQRSYKVDIETNSTIEPEAVEDQKHIAEVMNALGQFLNGIGPLVDKGVMPFQAAQSMMLAVTRRYRFGDEIEDYIKAMKQPQKQDDGKAQAEAQKMQMEMQMQQDDHAAKKQQQALDFALEQKKAQLEEQRLANEAEFEREQHAARMEEIQAKRQLAITVANSKIVVAQATARSKEAAASKQSGTTQ